MHSSMHKYILGVIYMGNLFIEAMRTFLSHSKNII